jgi:hypothetical protein
MNTGLFPPSKRTGLLVHGLLIITLATLCTWGFWRLSEAGPGPMFVIYLLFGLTTFAPIPLLGYRAYALYRAQYRLDRDGLELRWGLRDELIPLADIEWVRSVRDLTHPMTMPPVRMPGAILGLRRHRDLGVVEFLASNSRNLLLVATPRRVYAISPAEPVDFVETFARAVELGSLKAANPKSMYPSFVFAQAWESGLARYLWLATLFLNVGLAAWVSLLIPSSSRFALGFRPDRTSDVVPALQLVILPLISAFLSLVGWVAGLFFYRWRKWRVLSLLIWASGTLSSVLFLIAILFIVSAPV